MLYSDKKELLELYNAVNGTEYEDSEQLEINTLENAIYMSMQNDVSFIIEMWLNLYEHQSTYSTNLPIRYLLYVADVYSDYTNILLVQFLLFLIHLCSKHCKVHNMYALIISFFSSSVYVILISYVVDADCGFS